MKCTIAMMAVALVTTLVGASPASAGSAADVVSVHTDDVRVSPQTKCAKAKFTLVVPDGIPHWAISVALQDPDGALVGSETYNDEADAREIAGHFSLCEDEAVGSYTLVADVAPQDDNHVPLGAYQVTAGFDFSRDKPAPVRLHPHQGYGAWIGGRTAASGLLRYQIDRAPNDDMTKMGRTLSITSRSKKPIHYKAVLRSAKGTRVMTGWVGGKRKDGLPPMDWFWGLRRGETYKTIRMFQKS